MDLPSSLLEKNRSNYEESILDFILISAFQLTVLNQKEIIFSSVEDVGLNKFTLVEQLSRIRYSAKYEFVVAEH